MMQLSFGYKGKHSQSKRKDLPNLSEANQLRSRYCPHRKFALAPSDKSNLLKSYQDSTIITAASRDGAEVAMGYRMVDTSFETNGVIASIAEHGESMIASFLEAISKVRQLTYSNDDDLADRISRRYTVIILTLFAVIVSTKQYVGDPIACWTPAQFTGAHVEYTNYICWISNKYYVDFESRLPGRDDVRHHKIAYYQWVPFILLGMTIFFHLPSTIWTFYAIENGIDIGAIIKTLMTMDDIHWPTRNKTLVNVSIQISNFIRTYDRSENTSLINAWTRFLPHYQVKNISTISANNWKGERTQRRRRLSLFYFLIKCMYTVNAALQIYMLEFFIAENHIAYGLNVIMRVISGGDWSLNMRFPRVTYCDFTIRTMGDNLHQHTVQCVLPINLFNEKIFIVIWFWFFLVFFISGLGILRLIWILIPINRYRFLKRLLNMTIRSNASNAAVSSKVFQRKAHVRKYMKDFVNHYLGIDGYLVVYLITTNTNELVTAEIIHILWNNFCSSKESKDEAMFHSS
ncbi:hypothetical protein GJ496_011785 [Pomphorhynchus laevis]|nr:hypothetical protein GJ496_011785 [Pomphorhynchus laevis]